MRRNEAGDPKKAGIRRSAGVFAVLIFLAQFSVSLCFGQEMAGIPSSVKSPEDVEKWLSGFKSQMQLPDAPQTVEGILDSRAGDCDDFAKLASKALEGLGIPSTILVIKFKDTDIRHAICLWKDENGSYDFFSSKDLVHTGEKDVDAVLRRYYPTFESVAALTPANGPPF